MQPVGYKMDTVYFGWIGNDPVEIPEDLELPQFNLVEKVLNDCSTNYTTGECYSSGFWVTLRMIWQNSFRK